MQNKFNCLLNFKKILTAFIGTLVVIAFVITVLSGILHFRLLNEHFYMEHIVDDEYLDSVKGYAAEDIKQEAVFYGIDAQSLINCIDDDKIKELSIQYIEGLYLFFDGTAELPEVYYPDEDFFTVINEHYTALGDINEEEDRKIARVMAGRVENNINSMSNLSIVTSIFKSSLAGIVRNFTKSFWLIFGVSIALLFFYGYLVRTSILDWIRKILGILMLSCVFTFVPILSVKVFDLPSKLIIMDSPLKTLIDSLVYKTVDDTFWLLLIFSIAVFIAFTVICGFCAVKISKELTKQSPVEETVNVE